MKGDFWEEQFARISDPIAELDDKIDAAEREIGLNDQLMVLLQSDGWGAFRSLLIQKYQHKTRQLARAVDASDREIGYYQGEIAAVETILGDADGAAKSTAEQRQRLDQLRAQRKTLQERAEAFAANPSS